MRFQLTVFPCFEISQFDAGFLDAVQLRHFIADAFHHLPYLPVSSLMNDHLQFGAFFIVVLPQQRYRTWRGHSAIDHDAVLQFFYFFFADQTVDGDAVSLIDLIAGVNDLLHQFSVVRQQQESGTAEIQTSDRIQAIRDIDQIQDRRTASVIGCGRNDVLRFVQQKNDLFFTP